MPETSLLGNPFRSSF